MRRIAIVGFKGGIGKTTTCVNLAGALSEKGVSMLLVDMDYQSNLSLGVGINPERDGPGMGELLLFPDVGFREIMCAWFWMIAQHKQIF